VPLVRGAGSPSNTSPLGPGPGRHLAQCGQGRGLSPYQVAPGSIQPFGWYEPFLGSGEPFDKRLPNNTWLTTFRLKKLHVKAVNRTSATQCWKCTIKYKTYWYCTQNSEKTESRSPTTYYIIKFKFVFHTPITPYTRQHRKLFCSVQCISRIQNIPSWRYLISKKHYTSPIYDDKVSMHWYRRLSQGRIKAQAN